MIAPTDPPRRLSGRLALAASTRGLGAWFGRMVAAQCVVCMRFPATTVCVDCMRDLGSMALSRCGLCAVPLDAGQLASHGPCICPACQAAPPPWAAAAAAVDYTFPWDQLVGRFKFHGEPGLAGPMGRIMAASPAVSGLLAQVDCLVPMPLSAQRLALRGFNQALELAQALAPRLVQPRLLLRVRDTAPQHELPRALRLDNLRHAFSPNPSLADLLRGRTVGLVDDVMTTGASLREAVNCLLDAGAARVLTLVFARATDGRATRAAAG